MSSDWNNAIESYLGGKRQAIQEALEAKEAALTAKAGLIQAQTSEDVGMAGDTFVDKLKEEGNKMTADMLTDMSAAGLAPTIFKGAARLATSRAGQLQSQWKTTQARRFAEQEGLNPDDAVPESEGTLRGAASDVGGALEDAAGRAGQFVKGVVGQARSALQRDPMPIREPPEEDFRFQNPVFDDPELADPTTLGIGLPEGAAGNVTRGGQLIRQVRGLDPEMAPAQTSQRMGDAMNEAGMFGGGRGGPAPGKAPPGRGQADLLETDPEEHITGGALDSVDADADQAERAAAQAGDEAEHAAAGLGAQAEQEAGAAVEDLAPEITSAASGWGSLAGALGDAIPLVGFGIGAWALGSGIADEVNSLKDSMTDPFGKVRGEIAAAQKKITGLETNVSADEFASKLGAGTPSFGSLAARPQIDTAQSSGFALHD